ncbi:ketosteroid isomerase [bacterium SCGC AG-212-C10]|nr:ketosteroid isomerase [bacterium SCGC AG-212-C10]
MNEVTSAERGLLELAYQRFNTRDIDGTLALMTRDVDWPNGQSGGYVHGHDAVRAYWTKQWSEIDPSVTPEGFAGEPDGRIAVAVHQVVRDLAGNVLVDVHIEHVYTVTDGLVSHMEIRGRP